MRVREREDCLAQALKGLDQDQFYDRIIEFGKSLPPFPPHLRTQHNRVFGCQSLLYCAVELEAGLLKIFIDSDALISKGLGAFAHFLFDGMSIQHALEEKITIFEKLDLFTTLSLTRLNGLESLLRHILVKVIHIK
ncbi:MAG: SufE family protein [Verrucomicrobia bacterium]|nr:SufE family protein [Verrucomicrobiota bacterium]